MFLYQTRSFIMKINEIEELSLDQVIYLFKVKLSEFLEKFEGI